MCKSLGNEGKGKKNPKYCANMAGMLGSREEVKSSVWKYFVNGLQRHEKSNTVKLVEHWWTEPIGKIGHKVLENISIGVVYINLSFLRKKLG